jgi:hypothetical protein
MAWSELVGIGTAGWFGIGLLLGPAVGRFIRVASA